MEAFTFDNILTVLATWKHSLIVFVVVMLIRYFFKIIITKIVSWIDKKGISENAEGILFAFHNPLRLFLLILAFYCAILYSPLNIDASNPYFDKIMRTTLIVCMIWGLYNLSSATHGLFVNILKRSNLKIDSSLANIFSTIAHILIVILGFMMIAKEWNYDISAFIASLGIGSLAVALAAKDSLANVFGGMIILIDKPFIVGDWISANGVEGTVEKISFRSTGIRTFFRELVYVPNSLLTNTPITNFTKRETRRIEYKFGLTYSTTSGQMEQVVDDIKSYLYSSKEIVNDNISVSFYDFADSALVIRIVCYVATGDMDKYLNVREKFNFELLKVVEANGVSCAFPSRSLYIETPIKLEDDSAILPKATEEPKPVSQDPKPL